MDLKPPRLDTPARPSEDHGDSDRLLYLRSYLLMRTVIGLIGVALPLALLLIDGLFLAGDMPRGSLSAYYHTGMRDVFVGSLCVIGLFLMTYMALHYNWDNVLSTVAGVAVLGVAMFPTGGNTPLTPLQERLGEKNVSTGHMVCAAIFILSLAAISFLFGRREGRRPDRTAEQQARGKLLHWVCGFAILAAVAYVLITKRLGRFDEHSLFYGETVAVLAFGVSWLMKGLELGVLLRRTAPKPPAVTVAA
ncbi:MAG TPA: hypothetical protein VHN18_00625 [Micromonosporaceae bacterium]|nr:hypothetical protein [Micromonosporaceae bacterium]